MFGVVGALVPAASFEGVGALMPEVITVVSVLAAVAAKPVGGVVGEPVMVCVTPLRSTEMVMGRTTTGGSVGWGGGFGVLGGPVAGDPPPSTLFKNCSMGVSLLSSSGDSDDSKPTSRKL